MLFQHPGVAVWKRKVNHAEFDKTSIHAVSFGIWVTSKVASVLYKPYTNGSQQFIMIAKHVCKTVCSM